MLKLILSLAILVLSTVLLIIIENSSLEEHGFKFLNQWKDSQSNSSAFFECRNNFTSRNVLPITENFDKIAIQRHPNLIEFLVSMGNVSSSIPDIPSIRWTGVVFQESWKNFPKFLLYSAHFDARLESGLYIHILSLYDGENDPSGSEGMFCQFWFNQNDNPVIAPVYEISGFSHWKRKHFKRNIKVGICGKAVFYYNEDFSNRLIEWVEIMKLLGASKIFIYKTTCHKNIEKVLDFYEKKGIVKLISFYYPPPSVQEGTFLRLWTKSKLWAYRAGQHMYLNDCLLRNKNDFDYLGVFDFDELPVLQKHRSLKEMIRYFRPSEQYPVSLMLRWKTIFKDLHSNTLLPQNMTDRFYILNHNMRTKLFPKQDALLEVNGKTLHNTNQLYWISPHKHINLVLKLGGKPILRRVSRKIAYTAHFRSLSCTRSQNCYEGNLEQEIFFYKMKGKIIKNVNRIHQEIKLL